jgi:GTP cyclohydrolase I
MQLKDVSKEGATITMRSDEVGFLCSAINETLEAVRKSEFKMRTGETPERAQNMFRQLISVLREIQKREDGRT